MTVSGVHLLRRRFAVPPRLPWWPDSISGRWALHAPPWFERRRRTARDPRPGPGRALGYRCRFARWQSDGPAIRSAKSPSLPRLSGAVHRGQLRSPASEETPWRGRRGPETSPSTSTTFAIHGRFIMHQKLLRCCAAAAFTVVAVASAPLRGEIGPGTGGRDMWVPTLTSVCEYRSTGRCSVSSRQRAGIWSWPSRSGTPVSSRSCWTWRTLLPSKAPTAR